MRLWHCPSSRNLNLYVSCNRKFRWQSFTFFSKLPDKILKASDEELLKSLLHATPVARETVTITNGAETGVDTVEGISSGYGAEKKRYQTKASYNLRIGGMSAYNIPIATEPTISITSDIMKNMKFIHS